MDVFSVIKSKIKPNPNRNFGMPLLAQFSSVRLSGARIWSAPLISRTLITANSQKRAIRLLKCLARVFAGFNH